jgi:hypothetical protein
MPRRRPPVTGGRRPAPTRDPRAWRLGAASGLLVIGQSALLGFVVLFLVDEHAASATASRPPRWPSCSSAAHCPPGGRAPLGLEGLRIPLLRRIAVADSACWAPSRCWPRAGRAAVPGARPGRRHRDVLERPGLHGGRRDRRRAARARRMSLQNTIVSVGGATAPAAFGALVAATSWTLGFAVCAAAPVLAFVVLGPAGRRGERAGPRARAPPRAGRRRAEVPA